MNHLTYREAPVPHAASWAALSFWEFTVAASAAGPLLHEIFPDGCASIFYHRNQASGTSFLGLMGPGLEALRSTVHPCDVYWSVRVSPVACRLLLGRDPATVLNQTLPLSDVLPEVAERLFPELESTLCFDDAIAVFSGWLERISSRATGIDLAVASAVVAIDAHNGKISIREVADRAGLSVRQLQRRFRAATGLTPKQFARARRIRATTIGLVTTREASWAARAAEFGYADQSHLIREYEALTGRPPEAFARGVLRIDHGDLL